MYENSVIRGNLKTKRGNKKHVKPTRSSPTPRDN